MHLMFGINIKVSDLISAKNLNDTLITHQFIQIKHILSDKIYAHCTVNTNPVRLTGNSL